MTPPSTTHTQTDVLIIGSGISGLICALNLSPTKKVTLLTKKKVAITATAMAQGGIAAVNPETGDSLQEHENDTRTAGEYHNHPSTVRHVIQSAPDIIHRIQQYGVVFDPEPTLEGGHSQKRIYHTKDTTGKTIETALIKAIKRQENITIIEDAMTLELIHDEEGCHGCRYLKDDTIRTIESRYTVLATGGAGQVYAHTTNPLVATGDGIAMAHHIGATIKDMEFTQFHPTALFDRQNPHFLLSESLRGEGAILKNAHGEAFMSKYDSRGDLAPRDKVSQAIFLEQKHGDVYLDISNQPTKWTRERFPTIYETVLKRTGKDIAKELIKITPAAHYLCGGINVNPHGESSIANLYAVGETAYTGLHGANRLASNSLLEGAVYGLRAAENILEKENRGDKNSRKKPKTITTKHPFSIAAQPFSMKHIRTKIQHIMWDHVGIRRTQEGLKRAIFELERLRDILPPIHMINAEIAETRNLIEVGLLIAKAALERKKSLGCHWIE